MPERRHYPAPAVRALIPLALIALSLCPAGPPSVTARQDRGGGQYTIAVDVDLVVFNVTVKDRSGRHVSGLQAGDFRIYEGNRLQQITLFDAENAPASVGLVIDNSGSMREKRSEVSRAAIAFVDASNPEDEMFVVSFNEKVALGLPPSIRFTTDHTLIRSILLQNISAGMTALYDAVSAGVDHLKEATRGRKALVLLSDGGDNASSKRLDDVLDSARRSSATIFTIGIYEEADMDRNPRVLRKIADVSGGRAYFPNSVKDLEGVWRDIAGGIRNQYTIGYRPLNPRRDGLFRKVKITATQAGSGRLRVTSRDGYFAPGGKAR